MPQALTIEKFEPLETTPLAADEERAFQSWIAANKITDLDHPDSHYDYRGFWQETGGKPVRFGVDHFPDTYKQHGHQTFSVESKYSAGPDDGGHWDGDTYVAPMSKGLSIVGYQPLDKPTPVQAVGFTDPASVKITTPPGTALPPAQGIEAGSRFTSGRFAGLPGHEPVRSVLPDPITAGAQQIVRGAERVAPAFTADTGGTIAPPPSPKLKDVLAGGSDLIEGGFKLATPFAIGGFLMNPLITSTILAAGAGAQAGTEKAAEHLGATPETARFAGNLAAILAGVGAGKAVHAVGEARAAGAEARTARAAETQARQAAADVLGTDPNADPETLQTAYRAAARANHPDLNPTADPATMADINLAYQYLTDHPAPTKAGGGMKAWAQAQVEWLKSKLQPEAPAQAERVEPKALAGVEPEPVAPMGATPPEPSAQLTIAKVEPLEPAVGELSTGKEVLPTGNAAVPAVSLEQRNALARAEQETDVPVTQDLTAIEEGRKLAARVRESRETPPEVVEVSPPKAARDEHSFSTTQVNLPTETAKAITDFAASIPDDAIAADGRAGDSQGSAPHVTVKYGLHTKDVDAVTKVLANEPPVTVTLGKTSLFQNDEADVLKVDIDSPDLHRLNAKIADALETTDTHPDYLPHATIAYLKPGKGKAYAGDDRLQGQTVTIDKITFSTKDGRIFEIPLAGEPQAPATPTAPPPAASPKPYAVLRTALPDLGFTLSTDAENIWLNLKKDAIRVLKRQPTNHEMRAVIDAWIAWAKTKQTGSRQQSMRMTAAALRSVPAAPTAQPSAEPVTPPASPKAFTRPKSAVLDKAYTVGSNRFQRVIVTEQDGTKYTYDVKVRDGRTGALLSNKEAKTNALAQHRQRAGVSSETIDAGGHPAPAAPAGEEHPSHPDERAAPARRGVDAGGGEESRAARRRRLAAERTADDQQHEVTTLGAIVDRAVTDGYRGDRATLRAELDSRLAFIRDIDRDLATLGRDPDVLLRAIAKYGGISLAKESGWKGEIRWLQEAQRNFGTATKPKYAFGQVRDTKGVFSNSGLTLDGMLESLRQDDQFAHIETLNDLVEAIRDAASAKDDTSLAIDKLAKRLQPDWWRHFQTEDEDISFNPDELDAMPPPSDVLDTGEEQPRLAGTEGARQVGKADTSFRAPVQASGEDFNLSATNEPEATDTTGDLFQAEPPAKPKGPSGGGTSEAMAGLFSTTIPVTPGQLKQVVAVQFPEMVELAKVLLGTPSVVKRFRGEGKRGEFQHNDATGTGAIRLHGDLFKRTADLSGSTPIGARVLDPTTKTWTVVVAQSPMGPVLRPEAGGAEYLPKGPLSTYRVDIAKQQLQQLAATLAHEIGHLVDWLPDNTLKRGNLLGRLFTLRNFLKGTFIAADGSSIANTTIKAELQALSDQWRPWDPATASASFTAYRHSGKELFADAISVLLNNPGLLEQAAPTFYEQFFAELNNKPDVKQAFFALQDLLAGTPEELLARRRAGVRGMFAEGDTKAADLERLDRQERRAVAKNLWLRIRIQSVDKNMAVIDRVRALEKRGIKLPEHEDPRYLLEERNLLGAKTKAFFEQHFEPIYQTLTEGKIGWDTFGEALFYERIIAGDTSEQANPRGISPEVAEELYADTKKGLDPEQQRELADAVTDFRAAVRQVADEAYRVGLYKDDLYAQMQKNPAYATFRVIDHMEQNVTSAIYHKIGTLKHITNPATATILKTLVTFKAVEYQKMKLGVFKLLEQHFPAEIAQAKEVFSGKGLSPIESRDKKQVLITYREKGRVRGKYVDPYIAASLNNDSIGADWAVIAGLRWMNGHIFRPVYTTVNLGFQSFNVVRDFQRYYTNNPNTTLGDALKYYRRGRLLSKVRAFGLRDNATAAERQADQDRIQAESAGILGVTFNDMTLGQPVDGAEIDQIRAKFGVGDDTHTAEARPVLKQVKAVLHWIEEVGNFAETLPKAAGIYQYKGSGSIADIPPRQRSFIRRKIGSPDFSAGGTLKPVTNELLLFSNPATQAIRSDLEVATDPQTRSGFWWKKAKLHIVPKLLLFGALYAASQADKDDDNDSRLKQLGRALRGISEYDFTNYLPIPIGVDEQGNSIYVRIPQDEFGRLLGALTWKALNLAKGDKPTLVTARQVFAYMAGQIPSVSPTIEMGSDVVDLLAGRNPYDSFRSRMLFTDDELAAMDHRTLKKFLGYEFQQLGGSIVWKFIPGEARPKTMTTGQQILEYPVVSNIAGRWVRITNYGQTEHLREARGTVVRDEARQRLTEREGIAEAIQTFRALPPEKQTARTRAEMAVALAKQLYPDDRKEQAERIPGLRTRLRMGLIRGSADPIAEAVMGATSQAQRLAVLNEARQSMSPTVYADWLTAAVREGAISKALYGQARRAANAPAGAAR